MHERSESADKAVKAIEGRCKGKLDQVTVELVEFAAIGERFDVQGMIHGETRCWSVVVLFDGHVELKEVF